MDGILFMDSLCFGNNGRVQLMIYLLFLAPIKRAKTLAIGEVPVSMHYFYVMKMGGSQLN